MTDTAPTKAWPLYPGEHPTLPELRLELYPGRPAVAGRKPATAIPPYARLLYTPLRVLETSNPDRIRAHAVAMLTLADDLERAHAEHAEHSGQLPL